MFNIISRSCIFLMLVCLVNNSIAQGDLMITPRRLVFEGNKRVQEINLANTGKDTAVYTISFVQYKMDEEGKFHPIDDTDSTQKFAHKNLRFYPRSVTLAPNEAQSIKVQLVKANELAPGEYRSHLYFRSTGTPAKEEEKNTAAKDSGITIRLTPLFGITVPTLIRVGTAEVTGKLTASKPSINAGNKPILDVVLLREGNMSLYGDLTVNHIAPDGKVSRVGYVRGIAVYVPNAKRNFHLPLEVSKGVDLTKGKLSITYSNPDQKDATIAATELSL